MDNHVIHNPLRHQKQPPVKIQVSPTAAASPPCFLITDRDPAVSHFHSCRPKSRLLLESFSPFCPKPLFRHIFRNFHHLRTWFFHKCSQIFLSYPPFFFIDKPFNIRYLHPPWCTNQKFRSALRNFSYLKPQGTSVLTNQPAGYRQIIQNQYIFS